MNKRVWGWLAPAGLLLCVSCSDPQPVRIEKQYYPSGAVRVAAAMKGNVLHGPTSWYYPNGTLQSRSQWVNGVRTGQAVRFDSVGRPVVRDTYDPVGRLMFSRTYDRWGIPNRGQLYPIIDAPDTVAWGQPFTGSIRFGYPLESPATLVIGTLRTDVRARERWEITDTVQVVSPSKDGRFYFSYRPAQRGRHTFAYMFLQPGRPWMTRSPADSVSIDRFSGSRPFFVL
jgi:hypothetical protein